MGFLQRIFADVSDETREWKIKEQRAQEGVADFIFRIAEMTLVCGAVVYLERKLGVRAIASTALTGMVAVYARSRATAGMLTFMKSSDLSPRLQKTTYWVILAIAILLFTGIIALTNGIVPKIADVQRLS